MLVSEKTIQTGLEPLLYSENPQDKANEKSGDFCGKENQCSGFLPSQEFRNNGFVSRTPLNLRLSQNSTREWLDQSRLESDHHRIKESRKPWLRDEMGNNTHGHYCM